MNGKALAKITMHGDVLGIEPVGIELQDRLDKGGHVNRAGCIGFAVKAESLPREVRDPVQFLLGES